MLKKSWAKVARYHKSESLQKVALEVIKLHREVEKLFQETDVQNVLYEQLFNYYICNNHPTDSQNTCQSH